MMAAYGATHPGRQRPNNEDAFFIAVPLGAAVVADGMGGHNCGEVGSAITVQTVGEYLAVSAKAWVPLSLWRCGAGGTW